MRQSTLLSKTLREAPGDEKSLNAQLLLRAGFVHKEMAGVYSFLPLGLRTLNRIISVIREEMNAIGGQEVLLSSLQDPASWQKSGRWADEVMDIWFKTRLKNEAEVGLANTHEEPLTNLLRHHISSWRDLPVYPYQFQTKFRNELRARSGLLRTREFVMKDMYSFSRSEEEHGEFYEKAKEAYRKIFSRLGLGEHTLLTFASGGSFSEFSHEFQALCMAGEDTVFVCQKCRVAVNKEIIGKQPACPQCGASELKEQAATEVGNVFSLGTKFSSALGLEYVDEKGVKHPVIMGSYGIGPARSMATIVELFHDSKGILWPKEVAPFPVHLLALPGAEKEADTLYDNLAAKGIEALYDDRQAPPGEKLTDADLIGLPWRAVVSEKTLAKGALEVKRRSEDAIGMVPMKEAAAFFSKNA
ncbi:MAG: aminoacyl--tRNA ligase-related protein [bacterium]|nr:aminoacyl--tRNA ligase-related protein [bacterium]